MSFENSILFEYHAEAGVLTDIFDAVGPSGSGVTSGSYASIVPPSPRGHFVPARSGSKSIEYYQVPPPKSDAQGRVVTRLYNTLGTDLYLSWWIWIPNIYPFNETNPPAETRFSFAGFTTWFGPADNIWKYWTGVGVSQSGGGVNRFMATRRYFPPPSIPWTSGSFLTENEYNNQWKTNDFDYTSIEISRNLERWVHLQIHCKWAQDETGEIQVWINNDLAMNVTEIITDPRGYSGWGTLANTFATGFTTPMINLGLHHGKDNPEAWIFIDDIVLATQKVPEDYSIATANLVIDAKASGVPKPTPFTIKSL